jgi:cell division protein FtsB
MYGRRQRFVRQLFLLMTLCGMIAYVASDAVRGSHGLIANQLLHARIDTLKKELAALKAQRTRLERDAELLGPKAAEQPALLDEQARSLLDLAHPADIVIVNGEKGPR